MKTYTGMVELRYINNHGNKDGRFVIASRNSAKELKADFVPLAKPGEVQIIPVRRR